MSVKKASWYLASWLSLQRTFNNKKGSVHENNLLQENYNMNEKGLDILKDPEIEIASKYFLLWLDGELSRNSNPAIDIEYITKHTGLTYARIYRVRAQLVKYGVLNYKKKFCPDTGKRTDDVYELI